MTEYFIYKYLLKVRIFRRETSKSVLFSNTAQLIYSFSESSLHIYKAQSRGHRTESLNCSCRLRPTRRERNPQSTPLWVIIRDYKERAPRWARSRTTLAEFWITSIRKRGERQLMLSCGSGSMRPRGGRSAKQGPCTRNPDVCDPLFQCLSSRSEALKDPAFQFQQLRSPTKPLQRSSWLNSLDSTGLVTKNIKTSPHF